MKKDILMFDETKKSWVNKSPTTGDAPAARHGHTMICFYNYVFIHGGQGADNMIYDDLWVFDIVKEDWHMIIDSSRMHELQHEDVQGDIPTGRVGAQAVLLENFGAAVLIGGLTKTGEIACDIWRLDLDSIVGWVEASNHIKKTNYWSKRTLEGAASEYLCRWGHSAGLINSQTVFVFGGIDESNYAQRSVFAYDFAENEVFGLTEKGAPVPTRIGCSLLSIGNGMLLLYGGEDPQGRGSFSDLWHLKVHTGT